MIITFINWSAGFNIAAGVLLLAFWFMYALFLPYKELSTTLSILVRNRNWTWLNILGVSGAVLGLLGQAGILVYHLPGVGWLGLIGYFVASAGTALMTAPLVWDTILWPILDAQDTGLLDFDGPIYRSKTFIPFFVIAGLIYSAGYIMVGVGIANVGILPETGGILIAVGTPLYGMGAMFGKAQVIVRSVGVALLSGGLIWLGLAMV